MRIREIQICIFTLPSHIKLYVFISCIAMDYNEFIGWTAIVRVNGVRVETMSS